MLLPTVLRSNLSKHPCWHTESCTRYFLVFCTCMAFSYTNVTSGTDEADFRICSRTSCGLFRGTNRSASNYRSNEWVLTAASLTRNYRWNGKSFIAFKILVFSPPLSLCTLFISSLHGRTSAGRFVSRPFRRYFPFWITDAFNWLREADCFSMYIAGKGGTAI